MKNNFLNKDQTKAKTLTALVFALFLVLVFLICAPTQVEDPQTQYDNLDNVITDIKENNLNQAQSPEPQVNLDTVKEIKNNLTSQDLNKAKSINAKTYFKLKKLEASRDAFEFPELGKNPEERKKDALKRVKIALLLKLSSK